VIPVELKFPALVVSACQTLQQKMKMDPLDGNLHFFEFDFNSFIYILGIVDQLRRSSLYHMQLATLQACITFLACF